MKPIRTLTPLLIALTFIISGCAIAVTQPPLPAKQLDIHLANHLVADLPEQDVYVEIEPGSDQVKRITAAERQYEHTRHNGGRTSGALRVIKRRDIGPFSNDVIIQ